MKKVIVYNDSKNQVLKQYIYTFSKIVILNSEKQQLNILVHTSGWLELWVSFIIFLFCLSDFSIINMHHLSALFSF